MDLKTGNGRRLEEELEEDPAGSLTQSGKRRSSDPWGVAV